MRNLRHIFQLGVKELLSLYRDPVLLFLIAYSFTFSVYTPAKSAVMDVINASVAIVDEDDSPASRQIRDSLLPPLFLPQMGIKYVHGLFRLGDGMQLYVNRGIGAVTLPFRFRCQPEITIITLAQG